MFQLKKELSRHYIKRGNRYVFHDAYTLNSLAEEMWASGVDSSTLSRVLNGERLFNQSQLELFCKLLNLDHADRESLLITLQNEHLERSGFQVVHASYSAVDVVDLISMEVRNIQYAKERGLMSFILDRSDSIIRIVQNFISRETNNVCKNELLILLGKVYSEKSYASGCTYNANPGMNSVLAVYRIQSNLAKLTNHIDLSIDAKIHLAFAYYAQGNYQSNKKVTSFYSNSLQTVQEALSLRPRTSLLRLLCWRLVALNSIYLNRVDLFIAAQKHIENAIENTDDNTGYGFVAWALDSLSRGQSYFNLPGAVITLEKAKKYNQDMEWTDPLRETASMRNELEVLKNLHAAKDRYFYSQAEKGLLLSGRFGFSRYSDYFHKILSKRG